MTWTKKRLNNLFFFIGVAAVVVMLFTFDISFAELWQHLCQAGYWLIPIIGIWVFIYAINAWAWMCIIKGNLKGDEIVNRKSVNRKSQWFGPNSGLTTCSSLSVWLPSW